MSTMRQKPDNVVQDSGDNAIEAEGVISRAFNTALTVGDTCRALSMYDVTIPMTTVFMFGLLARFFSP